MHDLLIALVFIGVLVAPAVFAARPDRRPVDVEAFHMLEPEVCEPASVRPYMQPASALAAVANVPHPHESEAAS